MFKTIHRMTVVSLMLFSTLFAQESKNSAMQDRFLSWQDNSQVDSLQLGHVLEHLRKNRVRDELHPAQRQHSQIGR